jgi:hypothetical protein
MARANRWREGGDLPEGLHAGAEIVALEGHIGLPL